MARKALLLCGILSSLLYVGTDILSARKYEGYSYASQTVSELSAIGAPTRPIVVPLFLAYGLLVVAFGFGVRRSASGETALRITGNLLIGYGVICLAAPLFPMHQRGAVGTLTDTMHIVLTIVTVLFILLSIGFGAAAHGSLFCLYSMGTLVTVLLFGALAGLDAPRLAANQPTPWVGVTERINIGAYLLWVLVLAIVLLRAQRTAPPKHLRAATESCCSVSRAGGAMDLGDDHAAAGAVIRRTTA